MLTRMVRNVAISCVALAVSAGSAGAAGFVYGNVAGSTVDFLNVQENTSGPDALFESPAGVGDGLFFFPSQFAAYAANGTSDSVSSTLTMNVKAQAGRFLESITLEAIGDYAITGASLATSASVAASLSVVDVAPGGNGPFNTVAIVNPVTPYTSGAAQYSGVTTINLAGLGISEVSISYVNTLSATSSSGTTAFIQNKLINGPQISAKAGPAVPEPTAALVFGVGALLVGARVRRPRD